ncbi:uncharacterized protein LOC131425972 [Malaya genurostris]|uniref:uncharacterized protein LOC131425972 n=1 Tax=Malaya genurostris TaxID=325434 RepID=UPI0026F390FC|nr:uncharacterized protein LOC131425972 [Malaya genurostris]
MEPVRNNEANETRSECVPEPHKQREMEMNQISMRIETTAKSLQSLSLTDDGNENETSVCRSYNLTLKEVRKFRSSLGNEFIKKKKPTGGKISELNFSARFTVETFEIKLHSEGRLMLVDDDLLARVTIEKPELLDETWDFEQAKQVLLQQIRFEEVYFDELLSERDHLRTELMNTLKWEGAKSAVDRHFAMDCILLRRIFEHDEGCQLSGFQCLCEKIMKSSSFSVHLNNAATKLYDVECALERRCDLFPCLATPPEEHLSELLEALKEILSTAKDVHRKYLLEHSPKYLSVHLENVPLERIFLISGSDVGVLSDVGNVLEGVNFQKPLENLASRFTAKVNGFDISEFSRTKPLINPSVVLLCKSIKDLIGKIVKVCNTQHSDLIQIDARTGWHPTNKITWKIEGNSRKCLERQYFFIFNLLKYFEPGSNAGCEPFEYEPRLSACSGSDDLVIDPSQTMQESFIWYCLFDDALSSILHRNQLAAYGNVLGKYLALIQEANQDQLEFVRLVSHALADFIACTVEFGEKDEDGNSVVDGKILQKQLHLLMAEISLDSPTTNRFCEMVRIFTEFWSHKRDIIAMFPAKINLPAMKEISEELLDVVLLASEKNVEVEQFLRFYQAYNVLLLQLDAVSFDWIIRSIPGVEMQGIVLLKLIEPVTNEQFLDTFRVIDPLKFSQMLQLVYNEAEIPKHHEILIAKAYLSLILQQLNRKQWSSGLELSESDQLTTTTTLILMFQKCMLSSKNIRKQLENDSSDSFFTAYTEAIVKIVNESKSTSDFELRINTWTEIEPDLNLAFAEFDKINSFNDKKAIREAFHQYSEQFQQSMSLEMESRVAQIVKKLKATNMRHFNSWDAQFKQVELPKILAGIAALWFTSTPKMVEFPNLAEDHGLHGSQILCILRMLGVDDPKMGVSKRFSEIPPGEGKTLIIRIIAILMALTGHSVRVLCCNEYQREKSRTDLNRVFAILDVEKSISYSTEVDFSYVGILLLNGTRILSPGFAENPSERLMTGSLDNSVLLIDDKNVFRNYTSYYQHLVIILPGLDKILTKIWNLTIGSTEETAIKNCIYKYIESSEFPENASWKTFLSLPGEFKWISDDNKEKSFTNRKLFNTHLVDMIHDAGRVYKNHKWERQNSYYKTFHYLANEKSQTSPKTGDKINYGFLMMELPGLNLITALSDIPFVFGVFGENFHKDQINYLEQFCDIREWTKMPSVFGCSKLRFDKEADFYSTKDFHEWLDKIFNSARKFIDSHRSVIIVFGWGNLLKCFENEYGKQFSRLRLLCKNTPNEEKQQIIDEIGGEGIVTVVEWEMASGVDYKSSEIVERNGGVHVIQSFTEFFTIEEYQAKGLTARRGNQGSYEIILWDYKNSYDEFNKARERRMQESLGRLPSVHSKLTEQKKVLRTFVNTFKF